MNKFNTYLIKWYGPFSSKEELKVWEDHHSESFNLYAFQAKDKNEQDKYYCGMTYKQTVGKRMRNHDHHIHDFENGETQNIQIWIGHIANIKPSKNDVRICENLITSETPFPLWCKLIEMDWRFTITYSYYSRYLA